MLYELLLNDKYFLDVYSQIEILKKDFPVNHGFIHINNVIENAKNISKVFNFSNKETEMLLVACALHDIGYLVGRDDHPLNGAVLAKKYLDNKKWFNEGDTETICRAIASHGGKKLSDYDDMISCAMILSDKFDFSGSRYNSDVEKYPEVRPFLKINKTILEEESGEYYLTMYVNELLSDEDLNIGYFKKLKFVFDMLENAKKIKIMLRQVLI